MGTISHTLAHKKTGSFLCIGDRAMLEKDFASLDTTSEIHLFSYTSCGIEEVRKCINVFHNKSNLQRHVGISFYSISIEAQNALLKFLEEPADNITITLMTYPHVKLLPTVLSRVQIIDVTNRKTSLYEKEVRDFLTTEPALRSKIPFYKKMLTEKYQDEEKINKEKIQNFFYEVIMTYTKEAGKTQQIQEQKQITRIVSIFSRMSQSSASSKQIAEYIALSLPKL
jgi:hypothetical protein